MIPVTLDRALSVLGVSDDEIAETFTVNEIHFAVVLRGSLLMGVTVPPDGAITVSAHDHETAQDAQECAAWQIDGTRHMVAEYEAMAEAHPGLVARSQQAYPMGQYL